MKRLLLALIALLVMSASAQEYLTADQQKGKEYWDKAQVAYKGKDYKKAFKYYKKSAELGYNKGCYELAECYIGGIGTDTDYHKAIEWYRKAADLGFDQAQVYNDLGISNYHLKNYQEANRYFKMSLEAGDAWGGWNLAKHYFDGTGVQKDEAEAARLFAMAVVCEKRGDGVCERIVNKDNKYFYTVNSGWGGRSRDLTDFYQKYPDAAFALDYAHWKVNPNIEKPFEHYFSFKTPKAVNMVQQCADKGNRWAQFRIADLQWSGEIPNAVPQNRDAAIAFWEKNNNDQEARKNLVVASLEGYYKKTIPQEWVDKDNEQLLAKAGAKTGYDKGADDIKKLDAVYAEIDSLARGLKTGELPSMAYYLKLYQYYENHPESDKHGYREKAKPLLNFNTISEAMSVRDYEPRNFWHYKIVNSGPFGMIKTDYGPQWNSRDEDFRKIDDAISLCKTKLTDKKYGKFFQRYKLKLEQKQKVLKENRQKGEVSYQQALAEYRAEQGEKSSYSSSSSSSRSSSSSSSRSSSSASSSSSVDIENIGMPNYRWDGDWRKDSYFPGEAAENKTGENQKRDIRFDDADNGKIYRVIGSDGYWTSRSKRYRTLDDAIIAEYVYQKYGKTRQKGRY